MGNIGDGLKNWLGRDADPLPVPIDLAQAVVYVHDLQGGSDLVGVRMSGDHAYRYQCVPTSKPASQEGK